MTATCGNPHVPCAKIGVRYFGRLKLCIACFRRFERHGDGKRYDPWQIWNERKLQVAEEIREKLESAPGDHYEIVEQWQEVDSDGVLRTYAKLKPWQAFNEKRRTR